MRTAAHLQGLTVLAVIAALGGACGASTPSVSPTTAPSTAVVPSVSPGGSAASIRPSVGPDGPLVDAIVVTVSADVRVRSQPRVGDDSIKYEPALPLGTKLHVLAGPVLDSGYVWYKVQPVSFAALAGPGYGWIAIADHDGTPWVQIARVEPSMSPKPKGFAWGKPVPASIPGDALYLLGPRLAHDSQGYVLLTSPGADLWFSTDARHWKFANGTPGADSEIQDVGAGDLGFVAVGGEYLADSDDKGAVVLTSHDGQRWQQAGDPTFAGAEMNLVGVGRQAIVAFETNGPRLIWASVDGTNWDQVTTQSGTEVARGVDEVLASDGRLTAFVSVPGSRPEKPLRVDVWQSDNGADWSKIAGLPKSAGVEIESAAIGGGHWIAWGWSADRPIAWTSSDGVDWRLAALPGGKDSPGPTNVIAYEGGYVAVFVAGGPTYDTCGSDASGPFVTTTWTSPDGRSWHKQRSPRGVGVTSMVVDGGAIVGVGETFKKQTPRLVEVTAKLPASLAAASSMSLGAVGQTSEDPDTVAALRSSTGGLAACGP